MRCRVPFQIVVEAPHAVARSHCLEAFFVPRWPIVDGKLLWRIYERRWKRVR
ncbi:MAG: hypothetical protein ACKV2Q_05330 [Planctomycetaceae bacterium]